MGFKSSLFLASAVLPLMAVPAHSQDSGSASDTEAASVSNDIVVTARRKNESAQDVPQTLTAVSSASIAKLNLLRTEDVAALVPGLTLSTNGAQTTASIRGVSVDSFSGASPTVDLYFNETVIDPSTLFTALYDVGQIEVLRGPQGTLRGRTAPSGAITLSTRRADLGETGGYANMTGTSRGGINAQGAIGIPLIQDRLAIRVAGVVDRSKADFVRSVFTAPSPDRMVLSGRVSIAAKPVDNLSINLTYQHNDDRRSSYDAVAGTGSLGGAGFPAAGYNGPVVRPQDRRSLQQRPSDFNRKADIVTGSVDFEFAGHRLSYVGGYQSTKLASQYSLDRGNFIVNGDVFQAQSNKSEQTTQELRLSSDRAGNFLDYTIGVYYGRNTGRTEVTQPAQFLDGAFGSPAISPIVPGTFDPRYQLNVVTLAPNKSTERAIFGTVSAHLGSRTELSVGGRYLHSKIDAQTASYLGAGLVAVAIPAPCAALGLGSTYAGYCDIPLAATAAPVISVSNSRNSKPFVYNATLSHRFSDEVNVYAGVGSSWRQGPVTIGLGNATNDPVLNALTFLQPEKSRSYEIGVKTNFMGGRLRLNAAVFHQVFDGFIIRLPETPYLGDNGAVRVPSTFAFTANADAKVSGFDIDGSFEITPEWTIGGGVSYANGKLSNAEIPCRDANFDGVADLGTPTAAQFEAAGTPVAFCRSKRGASRDPIWSATAQTEYNHSFGAFDGYFRALFTYKPENKRQDPGYVVDDYALVNLYLGIRSPDGGWDVGLFAKNAFNTGTQLSQAFQPTEPIANSVQLFGATGYNQVSYTMPREFGLSVRYSFGSR